MESYRKKEEHEGEKYLRLLDLQEFSHLPIPSSQGTKPARDFLDICGEHARPMLIGFEQMDPSDPNYDLTKTLLKNEVLRYIKPDNAQ